MSVIVLGLNASKPMTLELGSNFLADTQGGQPGLNGSPQVAWGKGAICQLACFQQHGRDGTHPMLQLCVSGWRSTSVESEQVRS